MLQVEAGLIGGTGMGERLLAMPGEVVHIPTAAGFQRGRLIEIAGKQVFAMSRHSAGHKVPPHKVNYTAMALALKSLGARACFATAAAGALRQDWGTGSLIVCDDFIDFSGRFPTLFDQTVVHTDFCHPFPARGHILRAAKRLNLMVHDGGVYVCANGPRYETPAEIRHYRQIGGDVVGMTAATEAILMHEAGVPYGCLAVVTNLAAGLSTRPLDHGDVAREMEKTGDLALKILMGAVAQL
ncbi:MAG: MTAP family purine nucleoside phosphorylase [Fimbriimonadales bacterium]